MTRAPDYWPSMIRDLCREHGVSMRSLSARAGVHRQSLGRFLKGAGSIRVSKLERILAVFGYGLDAYLKSDPEGE